VEWLVARDGAAAAGEAGAACGHARVDLDGGVAVREGVMNATRPPGARIPVHEAIGAWPQANVSALLDARVRETPDRVYLIEGNRDGGRSYTFRELKARADRMSVALRKLGVGPGDVVSWQLPNWFEAPALVCAIDRVGAVSNPIITIYREREMTFVCREARSRVLVVPGTVRGVDHRALAETVRRASADLEHVLTVNADPAPGQRALESFEDDPATPLGPSPIGPHDVSMVFYTSGTTADPKGVLHTPSTTGAVVHCQAHLLPPRPDDRGLVQFPVPHIGGVVLFVVQQLRHGTSAVFMETFDAELAVDLIERHRVTGAGGPPAVLQGLFAARNFTREKMRSVRGSGSGAADVSPELMRLAKEKLGCHVYRSYGMTECPFFTAGAQGDPEEKLLGTDGRPVVGATARVVDERGCPVPPGVEGEVEAFGAQLCVGYLDPTLNTAFTPDGFFRTGDLAVMDAEGYLRITGRRKDVIIRKGENLSAKGIEDDLAAHPKVADVAVIGVPDAASGERVCACVVLHPGADQLTLAEVRDFMERRGVMRQKIPEQVELLTELPRNATGKVLKHELRGRFGGRSR
jgi:cyclohexanecarboxylate-CoA ligase